MSGALRKTVNCGSIFVPVMILSLSALAQTAKTGSARERLIGAWHLVRIDAPGPDGRPVSGPQPKGMLTYTRGASLGRYDVDEAAHTVTHHVEGSITRDLLVGKDLSRRFEFTPDGHLIIRSTRPDEHWFVTWVHD